MNIVVTVPRRIFQGIFARESGESSSKQPMPIGVVAAPTLLTPSISRPNTSYK